MGADEIAHWIHDLRDPNWKQREKAVYALIRIGKPAVEALMQALHEKDWYVRSDAAKALGEIGDARAIIPLVERLQDDAHNVQKSAAIALDKIGWVPKNDVEQIYNFIAKEMWKEAAKVGVMAVEPLIKVLQNRNDKIQKGVESALNKFIINSENLKLLLSTIELILKDKSENIRISGINALKIIGKSLNDLNSVMPALMIAIQDNNTTVRLHAINAQKEIRQHTANALRKLREQEVNTLREQIVKLEDPNPIIPALLDKLRDQYWAEQELTAEIFGTLASKLEDPLSVISALVGEIKDNYRGRKKTIIALGKIGYHLEDPMPAVSALVKSVQSDYWEVRQQAVWALETLIDKVNDPSSIISGLIDALGTKGWSDKGASVVDWARMRKSVIRTLEAIGTQLEDPTPVATLLRTTWKNDPVQRRRMAAIAVRVIMKHLKDPHCLIPVLIDALTDSDTVVRATIARALYTTATRLEDSSVIDAALAEFYADYDREVQNGVVRLINAINLLETPVSELTKALSNEDADILVLINELKDKNEVIHNNAFLQLINFVPELKEPLFMLALLVDLLYQAEPAQDLLYQEIDYRITIMQKFCSLVEHVKDPAPIVAMLLVALGNEDSHYWDPGDYIGDGDIYPYGHGEMANTFVEIIGPKTTSPQVRSLLLAGLQEEDDWVRVTAARTIAAHPTEFESLDVTVPVLQEAAMRAGYINPHIFQAIVSVAKNITDPSPLISALRRGLYENHPEYYIIDKEVLELLKNVALRVSDPTPVVEIFFEIIKQSGIYNYTEEGVDALWYLIEGLPDPSCIAHVINEMDYIDEYLATFILDFLWAISEKVEDPNPILIPCLKLSDWYPLLKSEREKTIDPLLEKLSKRTQDLSPIVIPFLQIMWESEYETEWLEGWFADQILELKNPIPTLNTLLKIMIDNTKNLREYAGWIFVRINWEEIISMGFSSGSLLIQALQINNTGAIHFHHTVIWILGELGDPQAIEPLRNILNAEDYYNLKDHGWLSRIEEDKSLSWLKVNIESIRKAAREALCKIHAQHPDERVDVGF